MSKEVLVKIRKKEDAVDLPLPQYATEGSSGMDLYADVKEPTAIKPGEIKLISAGIYISLPKGYEAQIRPRSGLALKHGITLVNTPGTIDSDYRGLISLIVTNMGKDQFLINRGDKIAQMIIAEVTKARFIETKEELDMTKRQDGGFGHTGVGGLKSKVRRQKTK